LIIEKPIAFQKVEQSLIDCNFGRNYMEGFFAIIFFQIAKNGIFFGLA
jgi:hypothetical protein